jgi:hypothetical protein
MRIRDLITEAKKPEAPKNRNLVAKNAMATTSGYGAHKDKKKASKQGDIKHKNKEFAEGTDIVPVENPTDTVEMDVPLMIRLFEYAREDAKTDMDLHNVADRLIQMSSEGRTLTMQDYDTIVGSAEQVKEDATAGSTASGNIAVGAVYPNKSPKQPKKKDGTAKNALDMKGTNLLSGGSIKR